MFVDELEDFETCRVCGTLIEWEDDPSDPVMDQPPYPQKAKCTACGKEYHASPVMTWEIE